MQKVFVVPFCFISCHCFVGISLKYEFLLSLWYFLPLLCNSVTGNILSDHRWLHKVWIIFYLLSFKGWAGPVFVNGQIEFAFNCLDVALIWSTLYPSFQKSDERAKERKYENKPLTVIFRVCSLSMFKSRLLTRGKSSLQ